MTIQTLYVCKNKSRNNEIKFGVFFNKRYERLLDSHEQFSYISEYLNLYDLNITDKYNLNFVEIDKIISHVGRDLKIINLIEEKFNIELNILKEINKYLLNNGGGDELIDSRYSYLIDNFMLNEIYKLGIRVRKYTSEEVNLINKNISNEIRKREKILDRKNIFKQVKIYSNREYQNDIIKNLLDIFRVDRKIYLELATGAGKSFITFEVIKELKPKIVICFSPRAKINRQNLDRKYLNQLNNTYYPISFNNNINKKYLNDILKDKKILITCCVQSFYNLYLVIKEFDDIFVWYDEAHWGIEESWLNNKNEAIEFWLYNKKIKYKFFTSASPNHNIVRENFNIFGELYQPIKIKELINQKWLCNINPYIFENKEKDNINLINYTLDNFKKLNKTWGLSFHNKDLNAFTMFKLHLEAYNKNCTIIKPFLIVGDNKYYKELKIDVTNTYDFSNLKIFEDTKYSIAYVVKKVDMGYDFPKLDFIIFCDPKISYKDIIQCIGRGCRPDCLDNNGRNKDKILSVLLPVFINDLQEKNDYKNIINVLRYLIENIGLDIVKCIVNKNRKNLTLKNTTNDIDYSGNEEISAMLLDLLGFKIKTDKLNELLIENKIKNDSEYLDFVINNKHLKLNVNVYDYEGFKWKPIVDPNSTIYYSTYDECNVAVKNIINYINKKYPVEKVEEITSLFEENGWIEYNKFDKKIPPFIKLKNYYY